MQNLRPEHPEEARTEARLPDASHIEGSELLANESRRLLQEQGFTDQEIEEWAHAYISTEHTGDVASFVAWIADKERIEIERRRR